MTVSADQAVYNVGDPITITVEYPGVAAGSVTLTVSAAVTEPDGSVQSASTDVQVNTSAPQTLAVGVSDSFSDVYSQVSNDAGTAVFSSTVGPLPA